MKRHPVVGRHKARGWWSLRARWLPHAWTQAGMMLNCEELDSRVQPSVSSIFGTPLLSAPTPAETALVSTQPTQTETQAPNARHEILFVDAAVNNYQQLLRDANPESGVVYEVFVVGADQDGMELMRSVLADHAPVDAIHVLSHARAGELHLGSAVLDQATLNIYEQQQWRWGQALTDHGDLLFYGCDFAGSEEGRGLLEAISRWTGADVAASTNLTGSSALGGDWSLEFHVGAIETVDPFVQVNTSWVGVLATTGTAVWSNVSPDTTPDVNAWDGSSFGTSGNSANVGTWRSVTSARAPTRIEAIATGIDSAGVITGEMWNGTSWSALPFTMGTANTATFMSMAVAYESQSGDAVLVWDNGTTGTNGLSYRVWNGTSWSAEQTITAPSSSEPLQMKLVSNPTSNEMILVVSPEGSAIDFAIVWNGSSWGNGIVLDNGSSGGGGQKTETSVAYESLSGHAVVVYDADQPGNTEQYRVWNGSSWSAQQTITPPGGAANGNDVRFAVMASDPNSNRIALGIQGQDTTWFAVWDGSSWGDEITATTTPATSSASDLAVAFESQSGHLLAVYGEASSTLRYRTWTSSGGWSGQSSGAVLSANPNTIDLYADPYSDRIMLAAQDDASDLRYVQWSGSSWGGATVASTDTGESDYQPFSFFWDLNKPPVLTLSVGSVSYTENASPIVLDASATVSDTTSANFDTGSLTVDFTAGGTSADRLAIRNQGSGAGQIGVSGSNVTYGGVTIGTFTGGTNGSTPLVITFNANATPTAVRALVRNITYQNVSDNPATAARTIRFVLDDGGPNGLGAADTLTLNLTAVNDAPAVSLPGSQTTNEDVARVFSSGNGNAITVSDVDAGSGQGRVTLTVANGTLTLGQLTGLTFTVGDGTGDATMTFAGTFANLNAALNGLSYVGNLNFNGGDTLQVTINDLGNSGSGGAQSTSGNVSLTISAVNDAPTLSVPGAQSTPENQDFVFSSASGNAISVADVDAGAGTERVTLTVANGRLWLSQTTGLSFTVGNGSSDATMTFTGTIANINAALNGLTYRSNNNYSGNDPLQITINDLGNTGSGGALSASNNVTISVSAVNDPPTISTPGAQTTNEDTALVFTGGNAITIADSDAGGGQERVTLSVSQGVLTLSQTTGLTFTVGDGTGDATMTFTGTLANINAALGGLSYLSATNYNGGDTLQITVNDLGNTGSGGAQSASSNIGLTVSAVNDAPTLSVPGAQSANEDTSIVFSSANGNAISVADVDAGAGQVRVTLTVASGTLTLSQTTGLTFTVGNGITDATMTFTGTLANINAALNGLNYTPNLNFNGADSLQVTINDQGNTGSGGARTASNNISLSMSAVNDAPTLSLPSTEVAAEFSPLYFSSANGNAISVADVDAGANPVRLSLTVSNGTLTLSRTIGLTFTSGDGFLDSTMTFTGTLANINAALDGLMYLGNVAFNGVDTLQLAVNDLGNTGSGGAHSATGNVALTISAVNDPPTISAPGVQTFNEDTARVFSSANGNAITVDDIDDGGGLERVTLTVTRGVLTLSQTTGLTFSTGDGLNDTTMTFTGTLVNLNAALNGLVYTPNLNYNGGDTLQISINDLGNTGAGGSLTASASVGLTISAVNDAPIFTVPGSQTVNEDTNLLFSSAGGNAISVSDVDAGSGSVQISLSATNGVLTLGSLTGLTFTQGDGTADATLQFTGMLAQVNNALNGLTFIPSANFNGGAGIGLVVSDLGNTGSGGALTDNLSISITVNAVNDAPTLATPGPLAVNEDATLIFTGGNAIVVSDLDANGGFERVTLTVSQGTLTLAQTTGLSFSVGDGTGDATMTFTGTLTDINNALNGLSYAPSANYNGLDTLQIGVDDLGNSGSGGARTASATVALTVNAVNDAPTVAVPGPQGTNEDTTLVFSVATGNAVAVADIDAASGAVRLTLSVANGRLTLASVTGLSFTVGDGTNDATMTFTGTLANVNAALNGLSYTPILDYTGPDTLTVTVNDQGNTGIGGALSDSDTVSITVGSTNDPPVIVVPAAQSMNEDGTLVFASGAGNAITASDPDAFSDPVLVTLGVGSGTLTLGSTTGLTFLTGDGAGDATMTFTGSLADVNAALDGLTYAPFANYNGGDTLTISIDDQGSTGAGGPQVTNASVAITVNAVNDAPTLSVPGPQATNEDTALSFSVTGGNGIVVSDLDAATGSVRVTLSVTNGTLTLANLSGLTFTVGDGTNDATMTFTGTLAAVNAALDGLNYAPSANYNGGDALQIDVSDLGNTGIGGALTASSSVALTVNAVNDAPTIAVPGPQATNEDTSLIFSSAGGNAIVVADVDAAAGSVQVTLSVSSGTLALASVSGLTFTVGTGAGDTTMTFSGSLANVNSALDGLTYTPALNYNGADTLQIAIDDLGNTGTGGSLSASSSVALSVAAINDAPTLAVPGGQTMLEDSVLVFSAAQGNRITVGDVDVAGGSMLVTLNAANGRLTLGSTTGLFFVIGDGVSDATIIFTGSLSNVQAALDGMTYAPDANYNGPATIDIALDDQGNSGAGGALSVNATVSITVTPVNDTPVSTNASYSVDEDGDLSVPTPGLLANAFDVENDPLRTTLVFGTGHGTLQFNADGSFTYTPDADFHGIDGFQYIVSDGQADSTPITVTITVNSVNDAPAGTGPKLAVFQGGTLPIQGTELLHDVHDVDGESLTYVITRDPEFGSLLRQPDGSLVYIPRGDFTGADTFQFRAWDGQAYSNPINAQIKVVAAIPAMPPSAPIGPAITDSSTTRRRELGDPNGPGNGDSLFSGGASNSFAFEEDAKLAVKLAARVLINPLDGGDAVAKNSNHEPNVNRLGADRIGSSYADRMPGPAQTLTPVIPRELTANNAEALFHQLNVLSDQIQSQTGQRRVQTMVAAGVATTAATGYVLWNLRNFYLLASLLTARPIWRQLDPMAILDVWDKEKKRDKDEERLSQFFD